MRNVGQKNRCSREKIKRLNCLCLKKSVETVEYRDWANTVFEVPNPIISGRPNVRLSDTPTHETVGQIIKPKVDELINLARNGESVQKN